MKRLLSLLLILTMLLGMSACNKPAEPETPTAPTEQTDPAVPDASGRYFLSDDGEAILTGDEFKNAQASEDNYRVFYEIFVGSFSDSDGDGVGDLRGILNRMDYLNDGDPASGLSLGVEGLWLSPVFKSQSYHKYDVNDYYEIDPAFGTMDDLQALLDACHSRNVKVILDLPINHTGRLSQWFGNFTRAHREGDTDDPWYDFYCYYHEGESAPAGRRFAQLSGTTDWYECNFSDDMPELNFDAPEVRQAVLDVARYYLDMGVDGFRFDAAKYIYFGENARSADFWEWYVAELKKLDPDIYTVAEVWDGDGVTDMYYPAMNCFNFTISQTSGLIAETAKKGNVNVYTSYVDHYLDEIHALNPDAMIVPFIANHDTDRAAGYLTVASWQMQMAANLYILSSGSPFLYYGEELGMRGSRGGASTDANRRLAMLWGDGDTVRDPDGADYDASNQTSSTVENLKGDGNSLLNYYKKLLLIRSANPEIARGDYTALNVTDSKMGGFVATWNGSSVCVLHNTTLTAKSVDLAQLTSEQFNAIAAVVGQGGATLEGTVLTLDSMTSVVLR
ncbi:MAG: hypothetical protein IJJ99_01770 [Oscillospiraceae bacterium]|nr:hypothetical protein [Oscillospiraceae bacterium]